MSQGLFVFGFAAEHIFSGMGFSSAFTHITWRTCMPCPHSTEHCNTQHNTLTDQEYLDRKNPEYLYRKKQNIWTEHNI